MAYVWFWQQRYFTTGGRLLDLFSGSPSALLVSLYPEHTWLPWRFTGGVKSKFWESASNKKAFLDSVMKETGITDMEAWYHIDLRTVKRLGGTETKATLINMLLWIVSDY
jgi:hypothetical protein